MMLHRAFALGAMLSSPGLIGCDSNAATAGSAAASATPSSTGKAAASAGLTAAPEKSGIVRTGEIETKDKKTKIGFSITLPEGLEDSSESDGVDPTRKYYRDVKTKDGYVFSIWATADALEKSTLEGLVAEAEKRNATVLGKDSWENGVYVVAAIEQDGKKIIIIQGRTWKGDARLSCRGNAEGPLAADGKASADVLARACKSLTITSP